MHSSVDLSERLSKLKNANANGKLHTVCVPTAKITQLFLYADSRLFWLLKHKQNHPDCKRKTQVTASKSSNENDAHKPSSAAER